MANANRATRPRSRRAGGFGPSLGQVIAAGVGVALLNLVLLAFSAAIVVGILLGALKIAGVI